MGLLKNDKLVLIQFWFSELYASHPSLSESSTKGKYTNNEDLVRLRVPDANCSKSGNVKLGKMVPAFEDQLLIMSDRTPRRVTTFPSFVSVTLAISCASFANYISRRAWSVRFYKQSIISVLSLLRSYLSFKIIFFFLRNKTKGQIANS